MPVLQALAPLLQAMTDVSSDDGRPIAAMRAAMHEMIAQSFTALSEPEASLFRTGFSHFGQPWRDSSASVSLQPAC